MLLKGVLKFVTFFKKKISTFHDLSSPEKFYFWTHPLPYRPMAATHDGLSKDGTPYTYLQKGSLNGYNKYRFASYSKYIINIH